MEKISYVTETLTVSESFKFTIYVTCMYVNFLAVLYLRYKALSKTQIDEPP